MAILERGVVEAFFPALNRRYGFMVLASKETVYFHINDGRLVRVGAESVSISAGSNEVREPSKGDILLFERSKNLKGIKAAPWCFATDWSCAQKELAARSIYRLMKQIGDFRITREAQEEWVGVDPANMPHALLQVRLNYEYRGGNNGGWIKYWFEEKKPGKDWVRVDAGQDPRQTSLRVGIVQKERMPLSVARRILTAATRNALLDEEFGDAELEWKVGSRVVATGYTSGVRATLIVRETHDFANTRFDDDDGSQELVKLGRPGKVDHNDSSEREEVFSDSHW